MSGACCGSGSTGRGRRGRLTAALLGAVLAAGTGLALLPAASKAAASPAGDGCCGGGGGEGHGGHGARDGAAGGGGAHEGHGEGAGTADAPSGDGGTDAHARKGLLVDLGNAKCPVMGGKADGETYSEWKGLRVGHCCPMCAAKFAADPAAALDRAGIEWKAAAAAVEKVAGAKSPADRDAAMESLKAKWKVLRDPGPPKAALLVDLGNAKCPVMGGKPDGKTFSEWNGLRVGHCCPGCAGEFAKDPARALAAAGIDWKPAAEAVKKAEDAKSPADRDAAMKSLKAKWKVVREPEPKGEDGARGEEPAEDPDRGHEGHGEKDGK